MKVGILTEKFDNFYSNGCNQQGLYLYNCLVRSPLLTCYLFNQELAEDSIALGIKLHSISKNIELLQDLDFIITVSGATFNETLLICEKPVIINYNCGNMYKIYQEQLGLGVHNYNNPNNHLYDITWTIPNYSKYLDFLTCIHGKQIKIDTVPYIWDSKLIDSECDANKSLFYDASMEKSHDKFILIAEPNLQTTKTCLIPLMICEQLYKKMKNIKIILLASPKHKSALKIISKMSIYTSGIIQMYQRLKFTSVVHDLKNQKKDFMIISHQDDNPMNFLHLETLYLGYPLIHNVKELNNAGYYYKTIEDAVNQILYAVDYHDKRINEYKRDATYELYKYSPLNYDNCLKYTTLLKNSQHHNANKPTCKFPLNLYNDMKLVLCYKRSESWREILQPHYDFFVSHGFVAEIKEIKDDCAFEATAIHFIYGHHLFDTLPLKYIICHTDLSHRDDIKTLVNDIKKYYLPAEAIIALSIKQLPFLKRLKDEVYFFPDTCKITLPG